MSFPRRGRGGGGNSGAPNPLASLPYVRQGVAPPAQLYPPFRGAYSDASADAPDALAAPQTEGLPQSLYPCVPLAPGSRDKRAVEAQLLLRQRMRLSAFYLTRAAALAARKRDPASTASTATSTSDSTGIDAALVVMAEALPAARALVPAELLEAGPVRRHDAHRPPRKRARGAGGDVDVEGLFSSLAQEEAREGQQQQQQQQAAGGAHARGDEKDDADDESDVEGSDGGDAEDESDADDGDYDMGQYGSDEDGGDDYGDAGGDDGDDGDDGGYD